MFMGEYNHTIDAKDRLIVPAKFRESLGREFIVTRGIEKCLNAYPLEEWHTIESDFRKIPSSDQNARKFSRFFFAGAASCEVDKQGRILLPSVLRQYAGLEKDVVLAGMLNRIEIWDQKAWQENTSCENIQEIADQLAGMGLNI